MQPDLLIQTLLPFLSQVHIFFLCISFHTNRYLISSLSVFPCYSSFVVHDIELAPNVTKLSGNLKFFLFFIFTVPCG